MTSELNPNHPVTQSVREMWAKFLAIYMHKNGEDHIVISMADVQALQDAPKHCISVQELDDGVHLKLLTEQEAHALAKKEGGVLQ